MKCPICNLTLADPPNGEENELGGGSAPAAERPSGTSRPLDLSCQKNTTPPYRAEVIDNAVLALSGVTWK